MFYTCIHAFIHDLQESFSHGVFISLFPFSGDFAYNMASVRHFQHLFSAFISGCVRLGIFWNKNIFWNIFRLFCSQEQNGNPSIPE